MYRLAGGGDSLRMYTYIHEIKRDFTSHIKEFEFFIKGYGEALRGFRQNNEMIRFVCNVTLAAV